MIPEIPIEQPVPPGAVTELAAGQAVRAVWKNSRAGITFQIGDGVEREFVKWSPVGSPVDLTAEMHRLRWAGAHTPVPRVLGYGADEAGSWLHTMGLSGDSAVADRWRSEPATAVRAIGEGLRALHDALPVAECPFRWSAEDRVAEAQALAQAGRMDPAAWHEEHRGLTTSRALKLLADIPPAEDAVVCHGDTCAPNTLIGDDRRWAAHVDLGALGVADRWADLAVATWSLEWNYGPGWQEPMLDAYGIAADPDRIAYYRLLGDLV